MISDNPVQVGKLTVKIGTRGSKLALWQAEKVRTLLSDKFPGVDFEVAVVKTKGDKDRSKSLQDLGNAVFIKELESALLREEIDLAVHSAKDLPSKLDKEFILGAVLTRDGFHDLCITGDEKGIFDLEDGAVLGTGSPRRIAQLKRYNSSLLFKGIRGNVDTRLRKLRSKEYDAVILSEVSLKRLGLPFTSRQVIPEDISLPAAGQGFIAVEIRNEKNRIFDLIREINDTEAEHCLNMERSLLAHFSAGCHVPVGALAIMKNGDIKIKTRILSLDGAKAVESEISGARDNSKELLSQLIDDLTKKGVWELLNGIRG